MTKNTKVILIVVIALLVTGLTFTFPPIAQNPAYHDFADKRECLGIPNFGDVMSNLPFLFFGLMGVGAAVYSARSGLFTMNGERIPWQVFFVGAFLVGFGSGYYHWEPNNHTLVWDRLPMTLAFMSFFSVVIMERLNEKGGLVFLPVLLIAGAASVFYWDHTESLGHGDLRPYALVQFLPMLLLPLMFWLLPARYSGLKYLGYALLWYVLAKVLEHFDRGVFAMTGEVISGHTLKHISASIAVLMMVLYVKRRKIISASGRTMSAINPA